MFIDPVDGTYYYTQQLPLWGNILTFLDRNGRICGSLVFMPCLNQLYWASKGNGAWMASVSSENEVLTPSRLTLKVTTNKLMTYQVTDAIRSKLPDFSILEVLESQGNPQKAVHLADILNGKIAGTIGFDAQAIDFASIGFIAQEAGGRMTDFAGNEVCFDISQPLPRVDNMLVAANQDIHDTLIKANLPLRNGITRHN